MDVHCKLYRVERRRMGEGVSEIYDVLAVDANDSYAASGFGFEDDTTIKVNLIGDFTEEGHHRLKVSETVRRIINSDYHSE